MTEDTQAVVEEAGQPANQNEGQLESGNTKEPPSEDVLKQALRELLSKADLQTTTEKKLRKQLEEQFSCSLQDPAQKALIRAEVEAWLAEHQEEEEEEEEEEEQEDEKPKAKRSRGSSSKLGSRLSPAMQEFLGGVETMPRTQVVKAIWDYIKANNLQDPKNKRNIIPDEKLRKILTPPVNMFSMNKQLSKHCKTDDGGGRQQSSDDDSEDDDESGEEEEEERPKAKKARATPKKAAPKKASGEGGKPNGFQKPLQLSEPLAKLVGQESMSRPDLTKFFWAYIKDNDLRDPADKRYAICDDKLKALFKVDRFQAFGMMKYISPHIIKS